MFLRAPRSISPSVFYSITSAGKYISIYRSPRHRPSLLHLYRTVKTSACYPKATTTAETMESPFATDEREKAVQSSSTTPPFELLTIRFSHYSEMARWCLDYHGLPYTEAGLVPLLHIPYVMYRLSGWRRWMAGNPTVVEVGKRLRKGDNHSTSYSCPILIHMENSDDAKKSVMHIVQDSIDVMKYVDQFATSSPSVSKHQISSSPHHKKVKLFPSISANTAANGTDAMDFAISSAPNTTSAVEMCMYHFQQRLGPHARLVIYSELLPKMDVLKYLASRNCGWVQSMLFSCLAPVIVKFIDTGLQVTKPGRSERAWGFIEKEFENVNALLDLPSVPGGTKKREFLLGDEFTAADVSFACMGGLILGLTVQDDYGAWLPPIKPPIFCEETVRRSSKLRESPAGQHILKCFRTMRGTRLIPSGIPDIDKKSM
eukprot:Nk52_evm114s151 gene=Nk52_evmTU114s151